MLQIRNLLLLARRHWPELVGVGSLLVSVLWLIHQILALNNGKLIYLLDDSYIHLAMAKSLALHHVWGPTQYEFAAASSSPLWVLLLAADFLILPVSDLPPLLFNLVFASAALCVAAACLRRAGVSQVVIALVLLACVWLIPLPVVVLLGMEHSLQILLVLGWAALLVQAVTEPGPMPRRRWIQLCVIAALMVATRFEDLSIVAASCFALLLIRHWKEAITIGLCGLFPLGAWAAFSVAHGWHALPTSVLAKAPKHDWHSWTGARFALLQAEAAIKETPHIVALLGLIVSARVWTAWRQRWAVIRSPAVLAPIALVATLLHAELALFGWFYRYEAYLIALGFLAVGLALAPGEKPARWFNTNWIIAALAIVSLRPFVVRAREAIRTTPPQANTIYEQQWQMARFLAKGFGQESVAVNDIGSISFLSNVRVLDLWGLANLESYEELQQHFRYSEPALDRVTRAHHVRLAIVYDALFQGAIPPDWRLLGRWKLHGPIYMLGGQEVTFYIVDPAAAAEVRERWVDFTKNDLPKDITVTYASTGLF